MKLGLASWQSRADGAEGLDGDSLEPTRDSRSRPFEPPSPEELSGKLPNLEVLELLGHGGMGAVYKGRQTSLDRSVAIKLIRPDAVELPGFAERFAREARALAKLNHPNIVTVHDFGKVQWSSLQSSHLAPRDEPIAEHASERFPEQPVPHTASVQDVASPNTPKSSGQSAHLAERDGYVDGPLYYLVMEYVEGTDLRQLISGGELAPEQALAIVPPICEALQFAHDAGIVHRDIKPENILIDTAGRVRIADFGLARLAGSEASAFTLTGTRQIMGTLRYMAPEQMEASHDVDHRADIYSLGVVFYEMLTGQVPAGHFDPPSKKVQIDVRLDEVVLRAMAREPERRYQHASDVKTDLETISSEHAMPAYPAPPFPAPLPICRAVIPAGVLLVGWLVFAGAAVASLFFGVGTSTTGFFIVVASVCGIASSATGGAAISQIRQSSGRLSGFWLAFATAVSFPEAVMNGGLIALSVFLANGDDSVLLFVIPVLLIADGLTLRWIWQRLHPGIHDGTPDVRRCVRGPAFALFAFVPVLLFPVPLLVTRGMHLLGDNGHSWYLGCTMLGMGVALLALIGVVVRGAWHLLALQQFDTALLGAMLGQPVGLWALAVLSRDDVKRKFATGSGQKNETPFPWAVFFIEFFILTAIFALAGFAMAWERSALPSALLIVPWIVMAGFGAFHDDTPQHRATMPNLVYGTLWTVGLLGFGVTLGGGLSLLAVLVCFAGMVLGAGLGSAIRVEGGSTTAGRDPAAHRSDTDTSSEAVAAHGRFGQAWDAWWQRLDLWVVKVAQTVLSIGFIACLIMYLSFQNTSTLKTADDGSEYRHTTITYGSPDPWFEYEAFPTPATPFQWEIDYVSSSMGLMLLGFLLYCVSWQIEVARVPLTGKQLRWLGSPPSIATFWCVMSAIAIAIALWQPSLLARLYDGRPASLPEAANVSKPTAP